MKTQVYSYTKEQKDWLKKIYPVCNDQWRPRIRKWFFSDLYSEESRKELNILGNYFKTQKIDWKPKIPLKDYL